MTAITETKPLLGAWRARAALWKEARKLWAESDRLRAQEPKDLTLADFVILRAEPDRLRTAGVMEASKGSQLWKNAALKEFGTDAMSWHGDTCTLANGDVYTPEDAAIEEWNVRTERSEK